MSENKKTSHPVLKTAAIILITVMLLLSAVIIVPKVARRIENYQTFMTAKHRAEQIVSERYGTDYAVVDTRTQYAYPTPIFGDMVETKIEYIEFDFLHQKDTSSGFIIQVSIRNGQMKLYRDGLPLTVF